MRKYVLSILTWIAFCPAFLMAQEENKYKEANYKEELVPAYELPELLTTFDGKRITSARQWERTRRPEIMKFFAENMYGKVPTPQYPVKKEFEVVKEDSTCLEGLCTRKDIMVRFSNEKGCVEMPMVLFVPNEKKGPCPAIYWMQFDDVVNGKFDLEGPQRFGMTRNGAPLKQLMLRGIALISLDCNAVANGGKRLDDHLSGDIFDLFFHDGQTAPKDDEWGMIGAWAYAMTSGMDYIVKDPDINGKQVAVMGCSIGAKVSIWAAALDPRIAMVLSATAGHGGDSLWRRQFGETLANMCEWLPRWVCVNAQNYADDVNKMPVDQHMLLACLAPRPLYVSNGIYDYWADNKGEWLATYHCVPAYQLYGKKNLFESEAQPEVNKPIIKASVGYHVRTGSHGLKLYDWERYMEFIEYHFMGGKIRNAHDVYYPNGQLIDHYPNKKGQRYLVR